MVKKGQSVSRETQMEEDGRFRIRMEYLDEKGREIPDPVPMAPPVGYMKQESMVERMRAMIRSEHLRLTALQSGQETFDEADDFEVGEDYDPNSPYEEVFDPVDSEARMRLRQADYAASVEARLGELSPMKPQGGDDGSGSSDKGRSSDADKGAGRRDSVGKGQSKPVDKSDDRRGVSASSGRAAEADE